MHFPLSVEFKPLDNYDLIAHNYCQVFHAMFQKPEYAMSTFGLSYIIIWTNDAYNLSTTKTFC